MSKQQSSNNQGQRSYAHGGKRNRKSSGCQQQAQGGLTFVNSDDLVAGRATIPGMSQSESDAVAAQVRERSAKAAEPDVVDSLHFGFEEALTLAFNYRPDPNVPEENLPLIKWMICVSRAMVDLGQDPMDTLAVISNPGLQTIAAVERIAGGTVASFAAFLVSRLAVVGH